MSARPWHPEPGKVYIHRRTNLAYRVQELGEMKVGQTWRPAVFYRSIPEARIGFLVGRETKWFIINFRPAMAGEGGQGDLPQ